MLNKTLIPVFLVILLSTLTACDWISNKGKPETDKEKLSYTIGAQIGYSLKRDKIEIDPDVLLQAIEDVQSESEMRMTQEEMRDAMMARQKTIMEARRADMEKLMAGAEKNKEEGVKYLAENKKKEGVVTLPSGLQYKVIEKGEGKSPGLTSTVVAHYRGTLIDGTEFDSSHKRGEPTTFRVDRVIKGWQEALQKMKPGAKWQVYIPSDLAYGDKPSGEKIGPNSTLIFDINLIEVK